MIDAERKETTNMYFEGDYTFQCDPCAFLKELYELMKKYHIEQIGCAKCDGKEKQL
jgi:hypothetical protein